MNKPVVRYDRNQFVSAKVGEPALLVPLDHPRDGHGLHNGHLVTTSTVIKYNQDSGVIETRNTIYCPYSQCQVNDMKLLPMSSTNEET